MLFLQIFKERMHYAKWLSNEFCKVTKLCLNICGFQIINGRLLSVWMRHEVCIRMKEYFLFSIGIMTQLKLSDLTFLVMVKEK